MVRVPSFIEGVMEDEELRHGVRAAGGTTWAGPFVVVSCAVAIVLVLYMSGCGRRPAFVVLGGRRGSPSWDAGLA
jgi:hypothetical protein